MESFDAGIASTPTRLLGEFLSTTSNWESRNSYPRNFQQKSSNHGSSLCLRNQQVRIGYIGIFGLLKTQLSSCWSADPEGTGISVFGSQDPYHTLVVPLSHHLFHAWLCAQPSTNQPYRTTAVVCSSHSTAKARPERKSSARHNSARGKGLASIGFDWRLKAVHCVSHIVQRVAYSFIGGIKLPWLNSNSMVLRVIKTQ